MWFMLRMVPSRMNCSRIGLTGNIFRAFSSIVDSHDAVRYLNCNKSCGMDLDNDDFVLPTKLESLADWDVSQKFRYWKGDLKLVVKEISMEETDAEEISRILISRFTSPEAVAQTLDNLCVKATDILVEKILKRFNNDWVSAFGFFKWAAAQGGFMHSSDSYDTMVDILGKSKQFVAMWKLVQDMVQLGGLVSLNTMAKVMRRLAGAGKWGDAIRTFHGIERFGVGQDTMAMNILLDTLCKEKSVKHATNIFMELKSKIAPDARSFNSLIHGWCQARNIEEALKILNEMIECGYEPCVITYTSLIEAYCKVKNFSKVYNIIDEMHARGCKPNVVTYTIIMHALGKAKETEAAFLVLEKMKRDGCTADTPLYNSLIYIVSKVGRLQDANDIFEEMCKNGISPNVNTYNTMITAACDHSQEDNALNLLLRMGANSCKPDIKTYHPLLKLCCKRRWLKILLYLVADMLKKDVSIDLGTYTLLVQGLCMTGNIEYSCLFFEEMVLKGFIPKQQTYTALVGTLERTGMDVAKQKVQELMLTAKNKHQMSAEAEATYR